MLINLQSLVDLDWLMATSSSSQPHRLAWKYQPGTFHLQLLPSVSSTLMNFVPFRHGHITHWMLTTNHHRRAGQPQSVGQWSVHFRVHCSAVSPARIANLAPHFLIHFPWCLPPCRPILLQRTGCRSGSRLASSLPSRECEAWLRTARLKQTATAPLAG